jgi:hypothetical protein
MITERQDKRGAISWRMLLLLAALSMGPTLTLLVRANYYGEHANGLTSDSSCKYGASEITYDANGVPIACKRPTQKKQKCASCTSGDASSGVDCTCVAGSCVNDGGYQNGTISTGSCTKEKTNCVSGTLSAPWKWISVGADGKNCYTMTETNYYTNQCIYPGESPCN